MTKEGIICLIWLASGFVFVTTLTFLILKIFHVPTHNKGVYVFIAQQPEPPVEIPTTHICAQLPQSETIIDHLFDYKMHFEDLF